ncbi:MAG: UDP-N-acetylmuramate dehydrogenase, partial [Spirochaetia bacterium]|nr:UDP-N-acetylmuramate dehydrogenase [Spirochaetia bacterium]
AGLPGTVGGALYMNARCYGQSISDVLAETYYLDRAGKYACLRTSSSDFDYKISPFQKNGGIILEAVFSLETGNSEVIKIEMEKYRKDRIGKGHFEYPCAGSVFKNDRNFGEPTGKIIDSLGLRGYSIGGAKVSEHHANIIVNAGNATAADIKALVSYVADRVHEAYGYTLEREIIYVDPEGGNDNT